MPARERDSDGLSGVPTLRTPFAGRRTNYDGISGGVGALWLVTGTPS
jgi:hypothetical protein